MKQREKVLSSALDKHETSHRELFQELLTSRAKLSKAEVCTVVIVILPKIPDSMFVPVCLCMCVCACVCVHVCMCVCAGL